MRWIFVRWYNDYDAKRNGVEDGKRSIPGWDDVNFPPYVMEIVQAAEEEIDRLKRRFDNVDEHLKASYCKALSALENAQQKVDDAQAEYDKAAEHYYEVHGDHPVGKRGTSIWLYRLFIAFLFVGELPMNTVVFRAFEEPEWLTILMTLLVAGILVGCAHYLGVLLRDGACKNRTSAALTLLIVLVPIAVMCGVAYMRESYLAAVQSGLREMGEASVNLGNAQLFWTFLGINAVAYLVATIASYFAHDEVSRTLEFLRRAIHKRDLARHAFERAYTRRCAVAQQFGDRMREVKQNAERLMNVYQTYNLRSRPDIEAERKAYKQFDLPMPACFTKYPDIKIHSCFKDPSKLDWNCRQGVLGPGGGT